MLRQIVKIDEEKCNGCGLCIPNCHEGALQVIDGKVRLVSDLMCDGLGACLGHCPEDALTIEEREAQPYDEIAVIKDILPKGQNTLIAHLSHLKDHNELSYLGQALDYLEKNKETLKIDLSEVKLKLNTNMHNEKMGGSGCGCPGAQTISFDKKESTNVNPVEIQSELRQWPVQLHLVSKNAPYFKNADVLLAADCVAFAIGNFHQVHLKGRALAIACPKLDSNMDIYVEKLTALCDEANINTLTVMIMEVPCCGGLLQMARQAVQAAKRKVPVKAMVVSLQGEILREDWV